MTSAPLQFASMPCMTGAMRGRTPPSESPTIRKGEFELRALPPELELQVWDYHVDPVHLSLEELGQLGLISTSERGPLPASEVAPWRRALQQGVGRDSPPPPLRDELSARALHTSGVALLPVVEGLDVYVISYHASPVRLEPHQLARLGLRFQSA
jgi:hypothetical protein